MKDTIFISDTHFPYEHPDMFKFLAAAVDTYGFEEAKHSGDMADNHYVGYHEIEYGTLSAEDEHKRTYEKIQQLSEMFPEMDVVIGNHGKLSYRKAKTAGIPEDHMKSYNDLYEVKWNWADHFYFKVDQYGSCLLVHSMGANTLSNARSHSHYSIQGHHHGRFGIEYFADTEILRWSMTVGCLIDMTCPAFNYARGATLNRPIIGCGGIVDNQPLLIPMKLKSNGRWDGHI